MSGSSSTRSQSQARPPISAGGPVDSKAKQDGNPGGKPGKSAGGAPFPRSGKRREPANSSFSTANPRRPPPFSGGPQQQRRFCPQSRGGGGWDSALAVEEVDEFEVGSLYRGGSKKQSLNHLLNFQFAPRGGADEHPSGRGGVGRSGGVKFRRGPQQGGKSLSQGSTTLTARYRKEHYLQANCQFVVRAKGDYSRYNADPDLLVDWELIEQVRLRTSGSEPTSCPICLFPPTAAKISRCGHVFCWPCILHYLALSDDNWRKCPICYESIQKADLRSVVTLQQADYATGGEIEMRLMRRERNSLLAVPVGDNGEEEEGGEEGGHLHQQYRKLIKATRAQVAEDILARERTELECQFALEGDQPEACFIQEALGLLLIRETEAEEQDVEADHLKVAAASATIPGLRYNDVPVARVVQAVVAMPDQFATGDDAAAGADDENLEDLIQLSEELTVKAVIGAAAAVSQRPRHVSSSSDLSSEGEDMGEDLEAEGIITADDLDISGVQPAASSHGSANTTGAEKPAPKNVFYFYQSSDGQPIFLHALNVQMLVQEFGTLENCPPVIRASILEKDSSTMTEELRDRLRYLRHLPVASSFEVAELQLGDSIISKATVSKFREQLESRRRKRARKQREERRRERRIAAEEMRIMGHFPGPMVRIESAYHYPQLGQKQPGRREYSPANTGSAEEGSVGTASPDLGTSPGSMSGMQSSGGGLSFAKIIRDGGARPAARTTAASGPRSVLEEIGMRQQPRVRQYSGSEDGGEGAGGGEWAAPPPPSASLGDALAAALARAETNGTSNKKKGKKGRGASVLLSGGAVRPRL